jgi:hypothetical protein
MDDIIRVAREAGLSNDFGRFGYPYLPELERFAALVTAPLQERIADLYRQLDEAERDLDSQYKLGMEAERNKLAAWMMAQGYATGHGETMEGLLEELEREVGFKRADLWLKRINAAVLAEREACAKVCDAFESDADPDAGVVLARAIRARGGKSNAGLN